MIVSFTWKPYEVKKGKSFGAGSSLRKVLINNFGEFPIILTSENIKALEVIENCGFDDIRELISALYDFESIEIEENW